MADDNLVKGIYFKTPHEKAPDFVKRKVSIKVVDFVQYLQEHRNESGYVNFDLNEAKSLHWYFKLDDWVPEQQNVVPAPEPAVNNSDEDLQDPF